MRVERVQPRRFRVTLHAYELAALVAAARWAAEGGEGEMEREAVQQLRTLLDSYEQQIAALDAG